MQRKSRDRMKSCIRYTTRKTRTFRIQMTERKRTA